MGVASPRRGQISVSSLDAAHNFLAARGIYRVQREYGCGRKVNMGTNTGADVDMGTGANMDLGMGADVDRGMRADVDMGTWAVVDMGTRSDV